MVQRQPVRQVENRPSDPKLKRTKHFWTFVLFFSMTVFLGGIWMWSGRIPQQNHGGPDLTGPGARVLGFAAVAAGLFSLYCFFHRAERGERSVPGFYQLDDFDESIAGHRVTFQIDHGSVGTGEAIARPVFSYVLRVFLRQALPIDFRIQRRDAVEIFLWYVGIERLRDVLTGHRYFDARYRVAARDRDAFRRLFGPDIIKAIERFDRDYPPIRLKNGWLHFSPAVITYTEGPYAEDERLFDPHRGKIEDTAAQLIRLAEMIEVRAPSGATG